MESMGRMKCGRESGRGQNAKADWSTGKSHRLSADSRYEGPRAGEFRMMERNQFAFRFRGQIPVLKRNIPVYGTDFFPVN